MKNLFVFFILLTVLLSFNSLNLFSQDTTYPQPPCYKPPVLSYQLPPFNTHPEYTTDMPLEVYVGYTFLDSLRTNGYVAFDPIMRNLYKNPNFLNDTMKQIMKYWYNLVDFNPVKFYTFGFGRYNSNLMHNIRQNAYPYTNLYHGLLNSDYILHVKVNTIVEKIDSGSLKEGDPPEVELVTAEVLDVIKGKVLPECVIPNTGDVYRAKDKKNFSKPLNANDSGACIQFGFYIASLHQAMFDCDIVGWAPLEVLNPKFGIYSGKEYIIFLQFGLICDDSNNVYAELNPTRNAFCRRDGGEKIRPFLAFPITNGLVDDSGAEMKFGTNLTVAEFKSKLQLEINKIKNP